MFESSDTPPAPRALDAAVALRRISYPLVIFSAMLAGMLLLSALFLLPRLTQVEVSGKEHNADQLLQYKASLLSQIAVREDDRRSFALAIHDATYTSLKEQRLSMRPFSDVLQSVQETAEGITSTKDAVHIKATDYDAVKKTLHVQGDVRFVETRSMTVLAQFLDALRALPFVHDIVAPSFAREEGPDGPHSPFSISITLQ